MLLYIKADHAETGVGMAIGGGTLSDMYKSSERAEVFGWYLLGPLMGPALVRLLILHCPTQNHWTDSCTGTLIWRYNSNLPQLALDLLESRYRLHLYYHFGLPLFGRNLRACPPQPSQDPTTTR